MDPGSLLQFWLGILGMVSSHHCFIYHQHNDYYLPGADENSQQKIWRKCLNRLVDCYKYFHRLIILRKLVTGSHDAGASVKPDIIVNLSVCGMIATLYTDLKGDKFKIFDHPKERWKIWFRLDLDSPNVAQLSATLLSARVSFRETVLHPTYRRGDATCTPQILTYNAGWP